MNIGIIGTGNMGKILIDAFIESIAVPPSNLTITNRTLSKARKIGESYPDIKVVETSEDVVAASDLIFICVKPLEIHPLLEKLNKDLPKTKCIVSITSPVAVSQLESVVDCQVARVIPSITNRALAGVSLITFGESCNEGTRNYIETLFKHISETVHIEDSITRVASDIVSCGPAFFSYLLRRFVDAAVKETKISEEQAITLASGMIVGMGKLIEKEIFTLQTLQEKVCVKGGVTGEGIKVLEAELGEMFEHLFQSTHAKYYEDIDEVSKQFNSTNRTI
ncbi:late competence protein ComER [Bacillus luteolus]|uniref:Pyrroline-5-carboxylate reductase n=1 Tax=Litchfieldia luteola TaxID=682179 RepID=A0ABR9QHT2_9BACI|nr:late competence protein ComER [Cytobacillus luteolus]MBE4908051.1 late competence protein ComER [Cytobacillus luteolus]MBP1942834.1 competence protein ComER [Cytobacillus luteolus]